MAPSEKVTVRERLVGELSVTRDLADCLSGRSPGASDARRQLEVEAAEFIGLEKRWHLVFWLPNPAMKLKMAKVLVGTAKWAASLHDHSDRVRRSMKPGAPMALHRVRSS